MTAATDDDWAAAAMAEDALVVDMLLRLKRSTRHGRPWAGRLAADLAPAGWGATQPRSSSASAGVHSGAKRSEERIGRSRRCSPSTPLSWSGGSGGGVDGCEASCLPAANRSPSSRSKITLAGSEVNGASSSKARKKKTYAELSEEEDMLLKERMHLNQELAMLGATVMEQRAENENLKRIKLDLSTQLMKNNQCPASAAAGGAGDAPSRQAVIEAVPSAFIPSRHTPSSTSCKPESDIILPAQKRENFVLPDLNMMPSELDSTG
uniref:Uncharacterized protein n=1 Tax=Kalanchoe fedtschenkoi TaxID=63787 RepID=A0A7N0T9Y2_KALFE